MVVNKKTVTIFCVFVAVIVGFIFGLTGKNTNEAPVQAKIYDISTYQIATFAGGCFWCMEPPFEQLPGVVDVISGYTGGNKVDPSYEEVTAGDTGHLEVVQIVYDPTKISYDTLLNVFWRQINPTDAGGQFVDRGESYTSAIFYHDDTQKDLAEKSINELIISNRFEEAIVTPIREATVFYRAEEYHQDYYLKNPLRYKYYRSNSGRDAFLDKVWGTDREVVIETNTPYKKPTDQELKERLTPLQYKVTQEDGTEPPFENEYWDNKEEGIYVDIVSGEPLFSSIDMFDSKTGWPSFTKPLVDEHIIEKEDRKLFIVRTEVRSKYGNSHLGHVFDDGPEPTGLRYCINSAALRFIPKDDLLAEGYGNFLDLFQD